MDKKLTAKDVLTHIDQLIQREMVRSGRTYKEVSQEFRAKLKARTEQKKEGQVTKYFSKAHQEATEAKMKSIEEWRKHPMTEEEKDRMIQEHFDAHGQKNPNKIGRNLISIWLNRDQPNEMHMTIYLDDQDYKRLQEIVEADKLPIAEAYVKMLEIKKSECNIRSN